MVYKRPVKINEPLFVELSQYLAPFPPLGRAYLRFAGGGKEWEFTTQDIKDLILSHIFEIPALQKALEEAEAEAQMKPEENEMATILKRALHHLERFAALYHSSPVDEVVIELRQLITEAEHGQVKGETLWTEPPMWEYKTFRYAENLNHHQVFTQMGLEGWELVAVNAPHAFFKRQK